MPNLQHEAYEHVTPEKQKEFHNHLRSAVARFTSEPSSHACGAIMPNPSGRIIHESYFNESHANAVRTSLRAALRLMGKEEHPKSEFKVDFLHGIEKPTEQELKLLRAGFVYRLRVWQPAGTFLTNHAEKIKVRKLFDLFHKMLDEKQVPLLALSSETGESE